MPEQDKTGPRGQGSLTGKGNGLCERNQTFSFARIAKTIQTRGLGPCGRGLGFRRGFCWRTQPLNLTKEQEKKIVEAELAELEAEKTEIEKQLKELKS